MGRSFYFVFINIEGREVDGISAASDGRWDTLVSAAVREGR